MRYAPATGYKKGTPICLGMPFNHSGMSGGANAIRPYNRVPYSSGNVMSGLPSPPGLGLGLGSG